MRVFEINSVPYGSTGRIMFQIARKVEEQGGEAMTSCSYTKPRNIQFPKHHYQIGGALGKYLHMQLAKRSGRHGCYSHLATKQLINEIRKFDPDVIHMHNLHGWFMNLPMFFEFLSKYGKPVVWTLHDCWAFTGHCAYYSMAECFKWTTNCNGCKIHMEYPSCYRDDSAFQYAMKKDLFTKHDNIAIVTPSKWLADEVRKSFLKSFPIHVIHNGIDTTVFKPTQSDFYNRHHLSTKIVLLGVAFDWGERKGLSYFKKLAQDLDDRFQIVLVGVTEKQRKTLPANIICIANTKDQKELAAIYTGADYLINPTMEDNFPTVNLESIACGTPVITYDTGGSKEMLNQECGIVIPRGNYGELLKTLRTLEKKTESTVNACIQKSMDYQKDDKYQEYVDLFKRLTRKPE